MMTFSKAQKAALERHLRLLRLNETFSALPLIRKLERENFETPSLRRKGRLSLMDSMVAPTLALLMLDMDKEIPIQRLRRIFVDPIDSGADDEDTRIKADNRVRGPVERLLMNIEPYRLFEYGNEGKGIKGTMTLRQVFEQEYIPEIRSHLISAKNDDSHVVAHYAALLSSWRKIVSLIDVEAIEEKQWSTEAMRSRARTRLRDTDSTKIAITVALSENSLTLDDVRQLFRDPLANHDKLVSDAGLKDYENSRSSTKTQVEYLQRYGLVHFFKLKTTGDGRWGKYRVEPTEDLNRVMQEFAEILISVENRSLDDLRSDD